MRESGRRHDEARERRRSEQGVAERPALGEPRRDEAREHRDHPGEREGEADGDPAELVLLAEDVEHERLDPLLAEVGDEHEDEEPAEHLAVPDERETFAELSRDVRRRDRRGRPVDVVDRRHQKEDDDRRNERERGDVHGVRCPEGSDREATDGRSEDARGPVDAEIRGVRAGELIRLDESGHDAEVGGHAPGDLDRAEKESDHVEQVEREHAHGDRDRDRERQRDAQQIAADEEATLVRPVDEDSGDPTEEDVGKRLHEAQRGRRGDRVGQVKDEDR